MAIHRRREFQYHQLKLKCRLIDGREGTIVYMGNAHEGYNGVKIGKETLAVYPKDIVAIGTPAESGYIEVSPGRYIRNNLGR